MRLIRVIWHSYRFTAGLALYMALLYGLEPADVPKVVIAPLAAGGLAAGMFGPDALRWLRKRRQDRWW